MKEMIGVSSGGKSRKNNESCYYIFNIRRVFTGSLWDRYGQNLIGQVRSSLSSLW